MDFFPGETGVATEEGIALLVRSELFTDVTDGHEKTGNAWSAVCCSGIETFGVAVNLKGTALRNYGYYDQTYKVNLRKLTVLSQAYLFPCESTLGGTKGFQVPPSLCVILV